MSKIVTVVFLRQDEMLAEYKEVHRLALDAELLPRTGDYVQLPISGSHSIGSVVLGVIWSYTLPSFSTGDTGTEVQIKLK